jgi:hypothetical protein
MCAGAAGLHHAHVPTLLAFILPAALPFVARYALEGTERGFGAAAMMSRAQGGVVQGRALFSLPGSPNACRLALEKLILPELGHVLREVRR